MDIDLETCRDRLQSLHIAYKRVKEELKEVKEENKELKKKVERCNR